VSLARRPSFWLYSACVAAVIAGLAWLTWQAARLESREHQAREAAAIQESVRLALWRMDSALAPIIAQEAARPYFHYRAFYPEERAYSRMWEPLQAGERLAPSPLLAGPGPLILLHFEVAPSGEVSSPQAPSADWQLLGQLPPETAAAEARLTELARFLGGRGGVGLVDALVTRDDAAPGAHLALGQNLAENQAAQEKAMLDYGFRKQSADATRNLQQEQNRQTFSSGGYEAADSDLTASELARAPGPPGRDSQTASPVQELDGSSAMAQSRERSDSGRDNGGPPAPMPIEQGPLVPVWVTGAPGQGPYLLFIRRISLGGAEHLQGIWMDWPAMRVWLLGLASDLLPGAILRPVYSDSEQTAERLAGVPAILLADTSSPHGVPLLTATRSALALTWAAVLAAIAAVGIVLRKSIELAERRGQFVSAVTHELRTPLTTFCLYTQMLADGMVQTDAARADYLGTLKRESLRLARIVENVLDFARLGQRARPRAVAQTVEELLAALVPALSEQARRAGMDLVIDHGQASGIATTADAATLERILTNLVENSTKYAADATDRRLHLTLARRGPWLEVRYRDHGPGIPRAEESRVFQPFHRAARDAEGPTAGLGLGLALSRGLARELGGDLRLLHDAGEGAEFLLLLPVV